MYQFSRTHPAANPAHYMYAPYGGAAFLADYLSDRRSLLDGLGAQLPLPDLSPAVLPWLPCGIETEPVLAACVACPPGHVGRTELADFFLRKIEVARQLRKAYAETGRPATEEEAGASAYALAAHLFADEVSVNSGVSRLRWLNALLKTGDILSLYRAEFRTAPAAAHVAHAIAIEIGAICSDADRLSIEIAP